MKSDPGRQMPKRAFTPRRIGILWVIGQALLLILWGLLFVSRDDFPERITQFSFPVLTGALLAAGGILLAVRGTIALGSAFTPSPEPKGQTALIDTGLYSHMRHPIYSGVILIIWGLTLPMRSGLLLLTAAIITLFFYIKAGYEEKRLCKRIPGYDAYIARTGRFFPHIHRHQTKK